MDEKTCVPTVGVFSDGNHHRLLILISINDDPHDPYESYREVEVNEATAALALFRGVQGVEVTFGILPDVLEVLFSPLQMELPSPVEFLPVTKFDENLVFPDVPSVNEGWVYTNL